MHNRSAEMETYSAFWQKIVIWATCECSIEHVPMLPNAYAYMLINAYAYYASKYSWSIYILKANSSEKNQIAKTIRAV